jgi:hypothetical protein
MNVFHQNRLNRSPAPPGTPGKVAILATIAVFVCLPAFGQDQQSSIKKTAEHSVSSTKTYSVKLKPPEQKQYCKANTALEYYQSDDVAEVNVEIKNEDCVASSGSFTVRIRYRTEEDEVVNLEFDETWQREDDQNILFGRQYPIGKNVDLVRVRASRMKCVCAESEDENENQE